MKPPLVSALALIICCGIFLVVAIFGYSRYKASQIENAEFRQQILNTAGDQKSAPLATRMPPQLSAPGGPMPRASASPAQ